MPEAPTLQRALEVLSEAVQEKGLNHVALCTYVDVDNRTPICIAGTAYHKLGVPLDFLIEHEGNSAAAVGDKYYELDADLLSMNNQDAQFVWLVEHSPGIAAIQAAQREQDNGSTWGTAFSTAIAEVARVRESAG